MSTATRTALAVAVASRVPVLLWGGPGTGKTSAIGRFAADAGLHLETVIASIREPSDFAGLPVVGDDDVAMAPPNWAKRLCEAGEGILFLDEISTAPPAVQSALLRVVLERTVGDLVLPDTIAVIAAANPTETAANGWDLAPPLANRFCHLEWDIDAHEWADGIVAGFEPIPVLDLAGDELDRAAARWRAQVGEFVRRRSHLLAAPPDSASEAGRAWPSPRSWDTAARLLAGADLVAADMSTKASLVAGCVGSPAGLELLAWIDEGGLPDPEAVLADPSSLVVPDRGDRAHATFSSIVAAVVADPGAGRWEAAWEAMAVGLDSDHPDLVVTPMRTLIANRPEGATPPARALQTLAPLLRSAGLLDGAGPR